MNILRALPAVLLLSATVLLAGAQQTSRKEASSSRSSAVQTEYFAHPDDPSKKIEVFWARPAKPTASPALVFIHGHQEPQRPGAKVYVEMGTLQHWAGAGYVAIAISQPGYGGSDGPPDFCGPATQRAVLHVIQEFRRRSFVRPNEVAIQGVSRGANVAAMVAAQDSKLAAVILISGMYDLAKFLHTAAHSRLTQRIAENVRSETRGASEKALRERSALFVASRVHAATLILHGAKDDRADPEVARQLGADIAAHGTPAEIVVFPDYGHSIPQADRAKVIEPFLGRYLKP